MRLIENFAPTPDKTLINTQSGFQLRDSECWVWVGVPTSEKECADIFQTILLEIGVPTKVSGSEPNKEEDVVDTL